MPGVGRPRALECVRKGYAQITFENHPVLDAYFAHRGHYCLRFHENWSCNTPVFLRGDPRAPAVFPATLSRSGGIGERRPNPSRSVASAAAAVRAQDSRPADPHRAEGSSRAVTEAIDRGCRSFGRSDSLAQSGQRRGEPGPREVCD